MFRYLRKTFCSLFFSHPFHAINCVAFLSRGRKSLRHFTVIVRGDSFYDINVIDVSLELSLLKNPRNETPFHLVHEGSVCITVLFQEVFFFINDTPDHKWYCDECYHKCCKWVKKEGEAKSDDEKRAVVWMANYMKRAISDKLTMVCSLPEDWPWKIDIASYKKDDNAEDNAVKLRDWYLPYGVPCG